MYDASPAYHVIPWLTAIEKEKIKKNKNRLSRNFSIHKEIKIDHPPRPRSQFIKKTLIFPVPVLKSEYNIFEC